MKKMNIVLFGDGKWCHNAFDMIVKNKNVVLKALVIRDDPGDEVLIKKAIENNIRLLQHQNINSNDFLEIILQMDSDLIVSLSFNQIFKKEILNIPKIGAINCHAGLLPSYRGRNILNWALINDEKKFGITVHFIDEGIDTGDIILQEEYDISDNDDYSTLLEKAYQECPKLLVESIEQIRLKKYKRTPQKELNIKPFYCVRRTVGDEIIDWNKTSRELFNFVRAIAFPGPCATSSLNNKTIKINKIKFIEDARNFIGIPGSVIGVNKNAIIVKTLDSYVEITDFKYDGKIRIGDRFI